MLLGKFVVFCNLGPMHAWYCSFIAHIAQRQCNASQALANQLLSIQAEIFIVAQYRIER